MALCHLLDMSGTHLHGAEFNVLRKYLICRGVALLVSIGMTLGVLYLNLLISLPEDKITLPHFS